MNYEFMNVWTLILALAALGISAMWILALNKINMMRKCEHDWVQYRICDKCGYRQRQVKENDVHELAKVSNIL